MVRDFAVDVLEFCVNREVVSFDNGTGAWEHISNNGNAHIVISEAELPDMSGFDFYEKTRKAFPEKTFIIMSQTSQNEKRAEELGVDAFLAKPFYVDELFELVQRYVIQS